MSNKKANNQDAKLKSMSKHSDESQNSETGYLKRGNPAVIHAKARAMRNNNNRTDTIH